MLIIPVYIKDACPGRWSAPLPPKQPQDRYHNQVLTNLEKQGIYSEHTAELQRYGKALEETITKLVRIHPQPINPHTDIAPPHCFDISVQQVECILKGQRITNTVACVHTPDGSTPFTMPVTRLQTLYNGFLHTKTCKPQMHNTLHAGTFPEEVHKLLVRYTEGAKCNKIVSGNITPRNQWTVPGPLFQVIQQHTCSTHERFASPLNYNTMDTYWSTFERDQLFGAHWDAYKYRWTGSSIATPDFDPKDTFKAVKHAIDSAKTDENTPVLTTLIIPAATEDNNPGYYNLIRTNADYCTPILQLPATKFRFTEQPAYMQSDPPHTKPSWPVLILEIANQAGKDKYLGKCGAEQHHAYRNNIRQALNNVLPADKHLTHRDINRSAWLAAAHVSKCVAVAERQPPAAKVRNLPVDIRCQGTLPADQGCRNTTTYPAPYGPKPLRYDWRQMAYTDGSYIDKVTAKSQQLPDSAPLVGAAVYIPSLDSTTLDRVMVYLPSEKDYRHDDTINRAKLVGLWMALKHGCTNIASDSLASIHQIATAAYRNQDILLNYHRHADLLQEIVATIQHGGVGVNIYKVPAHKGIFGNEIADKRATAVARGTLPPDQVVEDPSNHRRTMWWPYHQPALEPNADEDSPLPGPRPLPGLGALKPLAHTAHQFGASNLHSIYFAARKHATATIDKVSSTYLTSTRVTGRHVTNALKVLTGTLYTQARAFKLKKASTPNCLLCGQPDSTMHAVSGCPKLSKAVTKRHSKAVALISTAVLTGSKGADVVAMDVSANTQQAEGMPATGTHVPESILPANMPQEVRQALVRSHRPDIVMFKQKTGRNTQNQYILVEVKYCRDTDPADQIMYAREQHHNLVQAILKYDRRAKVDLTVVPLGVAGAVYQDTREQLQEKLGISRPAQETLLRNLHIHAVQSLTGIIRQRRIASGTRTSKCTAAASVPAAGHTAQKRPDTGFHRRTQYFKPCKRKKR